MVYGMPVTVSSVACWTPRNPAVTLAAPPRQAEVVNYSDPCGLRSDGTVSCVVSRLERQFSPAAVEIPGQFAAVSCNM